MSKKWLSHDEWQKKQKKKQRKYKARGIIHSMIYFGSDVLLDLIFDGGSKKKKKSKKKGR